MKELIAQMAADVSSMSMAEKMLGGLVVTLFSMVIVFIVLVIIMYAIKIMTSSLSEKPKKIKIEEVKVAQEDKVTPISDTFQAGAGNDEEEIAAVMAAIATHYASGETRIVIRNIARNGMSSWANAGMLEQLNSRL